MQSNWKALAFVAAVAAVGVLAGRAFAKDEMGGAPEPEKCVDTLALVKALTGKWDVKTSIGGTGTANFHLSVGKTLLVEDYDSKGGSFGDYSGLGMFKFSDDGKTITSWWFDTYSKKPTEFTGPATDTGYEATGGEGEHKTTIKFAKKGEGWDVSMSATGFEMTSVYTKAK